jgi:hypothetical protein
MMDEKNAIEHLKKHQMYPATKADLIKECDGLSDFSDEDKEWFKKHLMDKTYKSADEVIKTLGLMAE